MKQIKHLVNRIASFIYFKTMSEFTLRETANHTTNEELERLRKKYPPIYKVDPMIEVNHTKIRPDEELPSMWASKQ
jgi:hypothetical protein